VQKDFKEYMSRNFINLRWLLCSGHVAWIWETRQDMEFCYGSLWGNEELKGKDVVGRIP